MITSGPHIHDHGEEGGELPDGWEQRTVSSHCWVWSLVGVVMSEWSLLGVIMGGWPLLGVVMSG